MDFRIIPDQYLGIASDLSIIMSFFSLAISVFLLFEAKKIYKQFIGKARIPETIKSLEDIYHDISKNMNDFSKNKEDIFHSFLKAKSIVENSESNIVKDLQKKGCRNFVSIFKHKEYFFFSRNKTEFTYEESLNIMRELSALVVSISELNKDSQWS